MPPASHPDTTDAVEAERQRWDRDASTRDRVYETAIQFYEPATAAEVAERARCSPDGAREQLEWLDDRGIVEPIDGRPKRYQRNNAYVEWARANELRRERTDSELETTLRELLAEHHAFQEQYGVDAPYEVDALEEESIETAWEEIGEWKTIRRDIRRIERARKDRDVVRETGRAD
ncbi:DUF7342 family protein [Saliphagus infecundisoli]|uniref:Sugar-specific transcriptional regulator TrmB n=1 Tax=Saliphagus infecundisoli TaxID=1849069 RepID=A0ABD5QGQ3_9EURY|nr:hypothetical protein [Saliphagus infecundisoli]